MSLATKASTRGTGIRTNLGWQPPHRPSPIKGRGTGGLAFHAIGCFVNGGPGLPHGLCEKCQETVSDSYFRALMRVDQRVRT